MLCATPISFRARPPAPKGPINLIPDRRRAVSTADALAAVRRLSFAALAAEDPDDVYLRLAGELFRVFGVDQIHVSRLAQDQTLGRGTEYRPSLVGDPTAGSEYVQQFSERYAVGLVMESGAPLVEPDAAHSEIMNPALTERFGAASAVFVPLAFDGEVRAVVGLVTEIRRDFPEEEVQLVWTLTNQAAAALAVLELRARMTARAEQQTALARVASALNARLDLRAVLETLCREADLAVGGDLAGVYLGDAESGGLAVASHGMADPGPWYGYVIKAGEGVGGQVLATGEPAVSNAYKTDTHVPANEALRDVETAVSVPIRWGGELKGALSVAFHSMRRVDEGDIASLAAMADLAGVACSNAEAFEQAHEAARRDSLTGLLNHGAVHVRLVEEIARAKRTRAPLCCVLLDLDNFKPINDGHGHLVGDQILRRVAAALITEFRAYDGIGRLGGDEFVLVLPDTGERSATAMAKRVQEVVCAAGGDAGDLGIEMTTSVGIAGWQKPLTAGELIDRADRALLVAKRRGRNEAVLAGPDTEQELARLESPDSGPTRLLDELWGMVSRCERPADMFALLPGFLRRELELEECSLYVPESEGTDAGLVAVGSARLPGDPGPRAFRRRRLSISAGSVAALAPSAISRPTFAQLRAALGARDPSPGEEVAGSCAAVVAARDGRLHALLLMRSSASIFPLPALRLAELVVSQAVTALLGQASGASRSAIDALAAAIDARDNYTHSHSEQVVTLAIQTARLMSLPESEVVRVRDGAMLHDVGKVAIPNDILYKPGPLDAKEWEIMRRHPVIGEQILRRTPELESIAPIVRHEHERWDGGGYPDGLAGTDIPVASRVILACDAYNAMITARPYREPMTGEEALAELRRGAGTQFDPGVIAALIRVLTQRAVPA